jgi:glycosyl transferase family 2
MLKLLVVVPIHDRKEFITECLDSLRAQTRLADFLYVTGNVAPYLNGCAQQSKFLLNHLPFYKRVNAAIKATDCDAFVILADDDLLAPAYLEKTERKMEQTGADIVYTSIQNFGEINNIAHCNEPVTSLCRKSIWAKVGGIADVPYFDWDFWWSCREAGALSVPLREPLFWYRRHPEQTVRHAQDLADGTHQRNSEIILARHPRRGVP